MTDAALIDPPSVARELARRVRDLRLRVSWKQQTLSDRSGVPLPTLRRFERTGLISLGSMLNLVHALGRLDEFAALLAPPPARSIDELAKQTRVASRKRGRN
jgi:HTH-type transcriptional regulator / antitoxin HipB